jgi:hypothetical protein
MAFVKVVEGQLIYNFAIEHLYHLCFKNLSKTLLNRARLNWGWRPGAPERVLCRRRTSPRRGSAGPARRGSAMPSGPCAAPCFLCVMLVGPLAGATRHTRVCRTAAPPSAIGHPRRPQATIGYRGCTALSPCRDFPSLTRKKAPTASRTDIKAVGSLSREHIVLRRVPLKAAAELVPLLCPETPNLLDLNSSTRWSFHSRVLSSLTSSPPELGQPRPSAPAVTPSGELPTPVLPGAARALLALR